MTITPLQKNTGHGNASTGAPTFQHFFVYRIGNAWLAETGDAGRSGSAFGVVGCSNG